MLNNSDNKELKFSLFTDIGHLFLRKHQKRIFQKYVAPPIKNNHKNHFPPQSKYYALRMICNFLHYTEV